NIPVVMSLRDYKVVCGAYTMLANDQICEACRGGRYYQGFLKNCHKGSRFKGALITLEMYLHHKVLHIYDLVDCFISPSQFLKDKVEEMGFKGRVEYLPNFVYPDHIEPRYSFDGNALVYMGRLSHEKGVRTLIKAAGSIPDVQLKIIGDGPARAELENYVTDERLSNVTFLGYMSGDKLNNEIKGAKCVVIPSEWYENNPRSVIESFAMGKPVIGARIGGIPELVRDNETGMTFISGDEKDLSEKINYALADDERIKRWGQNARRLIEDEYSAQKHYQGLRAIYDEVLANARQT
ncbi:MAG: glycosyltransferase family 4 protein, partial [Candidatus Omnitrophica bacterium]|nr:glycosyltransferase family 4 protein [Candidatus Omnitrophota bacterium]